MDDRVRPHRTYRQPLDSYEQRHLGLVTVVVLTILSPVIWVNVLGNTNAIFPYAYPTLFSVAAAFGVTILVSKTDRSDRATVDRAAYPDQLVRSEIGQR